MAQAKTFVGSNAYQNLTRLALVGFMLMFALAVSSLANAGCVGNQCAQPPKPAIQGLSLTGMAGSGGIAIGDYVGNRGGSHATTGGGSGVQIDLVAVGNGCPGGCGDQAYSVDAYAWQHSQTHSWAKGPGATAVGTTGAAATVGFQVEPPSKD